MTILLPTWLFHLRPPASPSPGPPPMLTYPPRVSPPISLHHYATPGVAPPSARVDPKLKLQPRRPLRMWGLWKFGVVFASKATELTRDVVSHHLWGPRKQSWGIEMTIVSSLMRGAGRHSALVDIATIRMLMSIGGLVPLPSDALVTPVTFRVRKRQLRGILAEYDAAETGQRELSGEWVVGKKTWQRLQAEWKASHSPDHEAEPTKPKPNEKERVILYIHGGAYYLSSAAAQRLISIPLSKYADARVFALDYRLAPETVFPGPLHDAVSGYLRLVEDLQIPPENIIVSGDSAGGGLTLALLMYLRDNNYPLPSGAILMSPWVDLTMSCESWDTNAEFDVVPFPSADNHMNPIALYLGEHTERYLTHPYASPLFGDCTGLPPLLIQAGEAEVLRDEISLFAHKAKLAGVEVRYELYEDAIHVFQAYPFLASTRRSFASMREFVRTTLPQIQTRSPQPLNQTAEKELTQEIENENATVVGGDGIQTTAGMERVIETLGGLDGRVDEEATYGVPDREDLPSWGRSPLWTVSPPNLSNVDEKAATPPDILSADTSISDLRRPRPRSSTLKSLRRIRSALSVMIPGHSASHQPFDSRPPSRPISPSADTQPTTPKTPRIPGLTMSSITSTPNPPSQRGITHHPSHPNIPFLVERWHGPANELLLCKTEPH